MTYLESIENAKNKAVEFGLESEEYFDACTEMRIAYILTPKTKTYKVINFLYKILWQMKKARS